MVQVGGEAGPTGQAHDVRPSAVGGAADGVRGQGEGRRLGDAAGYRGHALDDLARDEDVAGPHRVAQPDLDRVEPAGLGQPVHLALVGEAGLHDAEAPHRAAGQVIGAHGEALDHGVLQRYGPWVWVMALSSTADDVDA